MDREPEHRVAPGGARVSRSEAFRFWLRLGFISFGGPAGQIAIMHRELVERRRWISEKRFLHALNYCMLLPGPEAQQLATYIGWLLHRVPGGLVAGILFVLPSVFVLLALSYTYAIFGHVPAVAGALSGFKPVVVAIVVEAILRIGRRTIKGPVHLAIAAGAFLAIYVFGVPFPMIVLAAGLIGLAGERAWPSVFLAGNGAGAGRGVAIHAGDGLPRTTMDSGVEKVVAAESESVSDSGALEGDLNTTIAAGAERSSSRMAIDDHGPVRDHTRPSLIRSVRAIVAGLALWVGPLALLAAWHGRESLPVGLYVFFTKAAFVTFGGAYAVLAYVTQAAAGAFGWITASQAIDGLALAETTPGPLIMVLQFVGFMAGWNHPGAMSPGAAALLAALTTTWTTFLPCFVFIFLGAPWIEVLRGNRIMTSALSGVTAAVVGVILNLALVFGAAVILPRGMDGGADWRAVAMSGAALIVLTRSRIGVHWVVLGGGLVGLALAVAGW